VSEKHPHPVAPLVIAAFAVTLWGLTPVATKIAVGVADPVLVGILRMTLAGAIAWPAILLFGFAPPRDGRLLGLLAVSCVCGMILFPLLFTVGQRLTSASHAALILAAQPIFTGLIAAAVERRLPPRTWWWGSLVALLGEAGLLFEHSSSAGGEATLLGDLVVLGSGIVACGGYVAGGRLQQASYPALASSSWGAAIASLVLAPAIPFLATLTELAAIPTLAWVAVLQLALGSSILAYAAWYWALGMGGIGRIGVMQFFQTPVGVAVAILFLGEPLTLSLLLSAAAILAGVYVAQRR
jgi:drug/metabolite transporter (DMT)-like permease